MKAQAREEKHGKQMERWVVGRGGGGEKWVVGGGGGGGERRVVGRGRGGLLGEGEVGCSEGRGRERWVVGGEGVGRGGLLGGEGIGRGGGDVHVHVQVRVPPEAPHFS